MKALRELVEAAKPFQHGPFAVSMEKERGELRVALTVALPAIERAEAIEKAAREFLGNTNEENTQALVAVLSKGE